MAFRDNQDRDKVLAASDIVEVVGEHVSIKAKGREFVGLCCFHDDSKPSMYVSPSKQIFKCFACGAGGSVFDFVMRYHKMTFPEALRYLADRAGIKLTPWKREAGNGDPGSEENRGPSLRERLSEANAQTLEFYRRLLQHDEHGAEARGYLERRGVTAEMIERFQLGVAPDRWDGLATMVGHKGWDVEAFVSAGLIKPRRSAAEGAGDRVQGSGEQPEPQNDPDSSPSPEPRTPNPAVAPGDCFDLLRHRLIFPICDQLGRPVAFGGRKLREEDEPKYLNSPESAVFHKSGTLYGLHLAKKTIIDSQTAVMVEGYTDVIACHQHGATNVVAALGTALTADHAKVLKRFAERIVLVMDGDEAGQRAADRAIEVFLTAELDVYLAVIPGGADPDELLQDRGLDGWNDVITSAQDALQWQFDRLAESLDDAQTVTGRQRLAEAFARRVVDAGLARAGALRRAFIVQRLAELLGLGVPAVESLLGSFQPRRRVQAPRPPAPKPAPHSDPSADGLNTPGPETGESGVSAAEDDAYAQYLSESEGAGFSDGALNQENQADSAVASAISGGKLRGLERAERRVIAALVTDNELFHHALPGGRSVDEAVAPAEFVTPLHRALYQRLFDALCGGHAVTLAGLLTDLAAEGRPDLADALHRADTELTRLLDGDPNPHARTDTLVKSAGDLLDFEVQRQREQARQQLTHNPGFPPPIPQETEDTPAYDSDTTRTGDPRESPAAPDKLAQLQALIEDCKTSASPKRIARVSSKPQ